MSTPKGNDPLSIHTSINEMVASLNAQMLDYIKVYSQSIIQNPEDTSDKVQEVLSPLVEFIYVITMNLQDLSTKYGKDHSVNNLEEFSKIKESLNLLEKRCKNLIYQEALPEEKTMDEVSKPIIPQPAAPQDDAFESIFAPTASTTPVPTSFIAETEEETEAESDELEADPETVKRAQETVEKLKQVLEEINKHKEVGETISPVIEESAPISVQGESTIVAPTVISSATFVQNEPNIPAQVAESQNETTEEPKPQVAASTEIPTPVTPVSTEVPTVVTSNTEGTNTAPATPSSNSEIDSILEELRRLQGKQD